MKILHTADWHLGAKTMGKDRLEGQKRTLNEICQIADENNIDIVIVAGDVYNTSVPTANAEEVFYEYAERLSKGGERVVVVVSGNHDDPERLCAGLPLAYAHNIVLAGDLKSLDSSKFTKGTGISVIGAGKGFIKVKKGEEIANIAFLPFDSTIKERPNIENISYSALVGEIAEEITKDVFDDNLNIFVSHIFVVGSKLSRDRVVSVGDVFAVSLQDLPKADYIALGHIHGAQKVGDNAWYSGSISRLRAYNGYNVSVNIIETKGKSVEVKQINLMQSEKYENIIANSLDEAYGKLSELKEYDLAQLTLKVSNSLKASEIKQLKKDFPCVTNVVLELQVAEGCQQGKKVISRKNLSDKELFKEFYLNKKGIEPRESLLELFLKCKGGKDEAY